MIYVKTLVVKRAQFVEWWSIRGQLSLDGKWKTSSDEDGLGAARYDQEGAARFNQEGRPKPREVPYLMPLNVVIAKQI